MVVFFGNNFPLISNFIVVFSKICSLFFCFGIFIENFYLVKHMINCYKWSISNRKGGKYPVWKIKCFYIPPVNQFFTSFLEVLVCFNLFDRAVWKSPSTASCLFPPFSFSRTTWFRFLYFKIQCIWNMKTHGSFID